MSHEATDLALLLPYPSGKRASLSPSVDEETEIRGEGARGSKWQNGNSGTSESKACALTLLVSPSLCVPREERTEAIAVLAVSVSPRVDVYVERKMFNP